MANWFSSTKRTLFCALFANTIEKHNKHKCKRIESAVTFLIPIIVGATPTVFPGIGKYYWIEILALPFLALLINSGIDDVLAKIDLLETQERDESSSVVFSSSKDAAIKSVERFIEQNPNEIKKIYDFLAAAIYRMTTEYCPKYKDFNVYIYAIDVATGLHKRVGKKVGYTGLQSADLHTDWKPGHSKPYYYESNIKSKKIIFYDSNRESLQSKIVMSGDDNDYRRKFSQYAAMIYNYSNVVNLYVEVIAFEKSKFGANDEKVKDFISSVLAPFSEPLTIINWNEERSGCDETAKKLQKPTVNPKNNQNTKNTKSKKKNRR